MIRFKKYLWYFTILFVFFFSTVAESANTPPARIQGTVTVDEAVLTQDTDEGYEFEVTREDGTSYDPAVELTDGLNYPGGYGINVPLYDADDQPGGAIPEDTNVIHVYKDGSELTVTSPPSGQFTVGKSRSITDINLSVVSPQPEQYTLTVNTVGSGNVTLNPAGGTYDAGTVVTLTAHADSDWQFSGWSGDLTGSGNPATINMNSNKTVTATFTQQLPVINSFSANHSTISEGEFVTLSWNITGATSATIDNGVGAVSNTSGTAQDAPTMTTTYTLTAYNPAGTVTRRVTVTAVQGGPVIDSFTASPSTINESESATLSWRISDADSATIDNGIDSINPVSGSLEVSPITTTTYTLRATNDNGSVTRNVIVTVSEPSIPEIVETIPHHGAGIDDSTRVSNMTSFSVRIEDSDGIDITDPASIRFTVDDGVVEEYTRDIGDLTVVRVIKLTDDDDTQVTKLWVAYDRSKEDELEDYDYDTQINIKVDVNNTADREMAQESYSIKTETEAEHDEAEAASPKTAPVDVSDPDLEDPEYTYNAGIKITSGKLKGAKIIYNSSESVKPRFGPTKEVPSLDAESEDNPMNLQPPNVFSTPVKLIIPYRGVSDVSDVCVFLFTGNRWVQACNADGEVETDGEGWMVPGSRVNHNKDKGNPSTIETKVYHFSAVQAGGDGPQDSCFIATSGYGSLSKVFCVKKLERFAGMYKMSYLALQTACVQKMLIVSFILALMAEGFIIVRRSKKYPEHP